MLGVVKIIETEKRMVVNQGWGERRIESYCLKGTEFYRKKRVLEIVYYTYVNVLQTSELHMAHSGKYKLKR